MVTKYVYACAEIWGAVFCGVAAIYLHITRSLIKEQFRALAAIEIVVGTILFCDGLAWYFRGEPGRDVYLILNIVNFIAISSNALMPSLFCVYILRSMNKENISLKILYVIAGISTFAEIFLLISHYYHFIYYIDPQTNLYRRGNGFIIWSVLNIVPIIILVFYVDRNRRSFSKRRLAAILVFAIFPFLTVSIQVFVYGLSLSNLSVMICALILFGQVLQDNVDVLIEQKEHIKRQEDELADMRNRIALSQIKPHFLYNTLNSIYVLCDIDKEKAKSVVNDLADYLRGNLGSIESKEPIPFEKELQHTKVYIELEKVRFEDRFDVEYRIEATDFVIPALTVQPLAENAIKHGLCKQKRDKKGLLTISSYDRGDHFSVCIEDNGVGFDIEEYYNQEVVPGLHIGLRNVRDRIKIMENADLKIDSVIGEGTKIEICIPK